MEMTRRDLLGILAAAGTAAYAGGAGTSSAEEPSAPAPAAATRAGQHAAVPLPFDPRKLAGLSERLLVSHHDNNYAGAVKNLNKVEIELEKVTKDTPGFLVASLRDRQLTFANSMVLHELYFGNLGGDGKPGGALQRAIPAAFGGAGRFEELLHATAMSLAGGSGWALLSFDFHSDALCIQGSANHTQSRAFAAPLLVLDMYEHAYQMDYGAAADGYVAAFFANLKWEAVEQRYERALKAARPLRS